MMAGMSGMNRREFGAGMAMLAAMRADGQVAGTGSLGASKVFTPAMTKTSSGADRWAVLDGTFATGEAVSMHESVVPARTPKPAAHKIAHSELIVVVEGVLSFEHDGVVDTAQAGSVIYVAYGTSHLVWNSGEETARYFVLQVGGDTKKV
jgi:quercetin dioxygenase-like cupin family protein